MNTPEIQPHSHVTASKRRTRRIIPMLLASMTLLIGVAVSASTISSASAATWLGGVKYSHTFHKWSTAWDFFLAGQPTQNGYNQMLKECRSMGGTYIEKAGEGTFSGSGGRYTVTFDYSCWN